jgi:hypothetical protein
MLRQIYTNNKFYLWTDCVTVVCLSDWVTLWLYDSVWHCDCVPVWLYDWVTVWLYDSLTDIPRGMQSPLLCMDPTGLQGPRIHPSVTAIVRPGVPSWHAYLNRSCNSDCLCLSTSTLIVLYCQSFLCFLKLNIERLHKLSLLIDILYDLLKKINQEKSLVD